MEGGGRIGEAEKHDHWFEEASVGFESGFPLITITNANVVISPANVQLRKECQSATMHPCKLIHEFVYQGEWGGISYSKGVKFAIVLYRAKVTVLLFDKKEWEGVGGFQWSYVSFAQVLCNESLKSNIFGWGQWVDFAVQSLRCI